MTSDKYVEKTFLYLLAVSLFLHAALFAAIVFIPQEKAVIRQEPIMIDLEDIPQLKPSPPVTGKKEVKRQAEKRERVLREVAPKGEREREKIASLPRNVPAPAPSRPALAPSRPGPKLPESRPESAPSVESGRTGDIPVREAPRGGGILKPRTDTPQLMPSAGRLAKLEETYRKKYSAEVAEGETKFLDTDDIQFGSFLRRFENSVYGVWRYPQDAARLGIEGVTPVKITFNSKGVIEKWEILQSSGSRILDNEVERTLRLIGPVGPFPKGYNKDKFHLVAFFQYGISRGTSRGMLR